LQHAFAKIDQSSTIAANVENQTFLAEFRNDANEFVNVLFIVIHIERCDPDVRKNTGRSPRITNCRKRLLRPLADFVD
jgi:hypothetical protein